MHPFEKRIGETIAEHRLLRTGAPVIVALSGGADSVALLSALNALGYECIAAHCNFHLRGAESMRDMRHAEKVARTLGVNIYIREFDVKAEIKRTRESIEMACRRLRYDWFHTLLDRDYSQAVAVGHHREDNIETFFINLMRSTGLRGLTGMDYRRDYVVRPMLDTTRAEIETYLADRGLEYADDSSNATNDYVRNRFRNVILPLFREHFPQADNALADVMSHLRDEVKLIETLVGRTRNEVETAPERFDVGCLVETYGDGAEYVLYTLLKPYGFNRSQIKNIVEAQTKGHTGLRFDASSHTAELDRGVLTLRDVEKGERPTNHQPFEPTHEHYQRTEERRNAPGAEGSVRVGLRHDIVTPVRINVSLHNVTEFNPERDASTIYLDARILDSKIPVVIRRPKTADRMRPFGMAGTRLVSDILKDAKYTAAQKRDTWLLAQGDKILWIIGLRASAHYSLNPSTRFYLRLRYEK